MDSTLAISLYVDDYLSALQRYVELIGYNRAAWVERLQETFKELSRAQATEVVEMFMNEYVEQLR